MPVISRFLGLVVAMYYQDHDPPHFHVRYGERQALEEGGRRPKGPAGPQAVESPGLRDTLIPKGPPLLPPPTGGGFRRYGGPPSRSALLCRGDAPTTKGRLPAKSAGAPTPAGPRVRVPRPTGDGAG